MPRLRRENATCHQPGELAARGLHGEIAPEEIDSLNGRRFGPAGVYRAINVAIPTARNPEPPLDGAAIHEQPIRNSMASLA